MPKPSWPTGADVLSILNGIPDVAQGLITAPSEAECADLVESVVDDFQELTGRIPFLASNTPTLQTFNPPNGLSGRYRLPVQLLSVSSLLVNVTIDNAGIALTQNKDFFLGDVNAPAIGLPYEYIDFKYPIFDYPQSVQITAVWGFGLQIPMDAWQAVRRKAAAKAIEQTMSISGPLRSIKQRQVTREYGIRGQRTLIDDLGDDYETAVSKYTYIATE